jgi:ribosome maturation factor RimP
MISLTEKITDLVQSVLQDYDVFLVDLEVKGSDKKTLISVYLDHEETGLNIDTCAKISRELSFLIESKELIEDKYTLNVSSPGLDRPLKDQRQYQKNIGRKASVKYTLEQSNKAVKGIFAGFDDAHLTLDMGKDGKLEIERSTVLELKILPVF